MSTTPSLSPGIVVAGRYRVESSLGGEGSSAVYRAVELRSERVVALRVAVEGEGGETGERERAARALSHASVARVLDLGTDPETGARFVATALGNGGSLAALLSQRGLPPLPLALRMVRDAAEGAAAVHAAGLVHGDLHPGMLWLSRDEGRLRVQLLGVGVDPSGGVPPRATARYASPERLRRTVPLTPAADVFALGAVAFEVLAGLPDGWTSLLVEMARGRAVVAPSPAERRRELPAEVAQAVRRALAADPAQRWADAGILAGRLAGDEGRPSPAPAVEARTASPPTPAPEPEAEATAASSEPPPALARRERPPLPRSALAETDLADSLYIPPAPEPELPEAPAPAPKRERVVRVPEPPVVSMPAAVPPAASDASRELAPAPPASAAGAPAEPSASAVVPAPASAPLPASAPRRPRGMAAMGGGGKGRRLPVAAGVVVALLVGGGVLGRTMLAGDAEGTSATRLAAGPEVEPGSGPVVVEEGGDAPIGAVEESVPEPLSRPEAAGAAPAPGVAREPASSPAGPRQEPPRSEPAASVPTSSVPAAQVGESSLSSVTLAEPLPVQPARGSASIEAVVDAPAQSSPRPAAPDPNRVYGGGEVDQPPALSNRPAFQAAVQRSYPGTLRGSGSWGSAVVTFVVLPDGRVDRSTVSVTEASHPAFRGAAAAALGTARFTPARIGGEAVRAQVSMPITWSPPGEEREE